MVEEQKIQKKSLFKDKKNIIIVILVIIVLIASFNYFKDKMEEIKQEGFKEGVISTVNEIKIVASQCQPISIDLGNNTKLSLIAVECLKQEGETN